MRMLSFLCFLLLAGLPVGTKAAQPLLVDLSRDQIDITTSFTGTRLLLFGAIDGEGDVVVVVRGPNRQEVVRRKERTLGIWVNRHSVIFDRVPGYYFQASTRTLGNIASKSVLDDLKIGTGRLPIEVVSDVSTGTARDYRDALIRLKRAQNLYSSSGPSVTFVGGRLFRTELLFPANVPTGDYSAEIYLFRDGRQISVAKRVLTVRKAGVEAAIYNFAHQNAASYGIVAIIVALFAGWLGGAIFRKA